ncbi:hypothetical protein ACN20G_35065 (plasmid) [Streptomyces sp. BI20]|uniref:hypothetical protein n=1 Tax=Streptomyces sp. BI20 TaxID=3403460 RepID=UPI003C74FB1A
MGISGFEPVYVVGADAIRREHGARLAALVGRRLTGSALVRYAEDEGVLADCPVVLDFEGVRVELCHHRFDELSIGWNTIDTTAPVTGWEWFAFTPRWSHGDERLAPLLGEELREVALLASRPTTPDLAVDTVTVEFVFAAGSLLIVNGLDENRVEVGVPHPDLVRHPLRP